MSGQAGIEDGSTSLTYATQRPPGRRFQVQARARCEVGQATLRKRVQHDGRAAADVGVGARCRSSCALEGDTVRSGQELYSDGNWPLDGLRTCMCVCTLGTAEVY
ncbi:hypothetical protein BJY52DRAFT_1227453 [Lactarius psammicola]|nr:hypothetical protein BJY52DRAFT_1227453 [Lactarius psammicola]